MIIDTHCHLDDERYAQDLEEVLCRADEADVGPIVIPGADPAHLERAVALAERYDRIWFAVGVHPYHAADYDEALMERAIVHPKCLAVGECGLDYYRLPDDPAERDARIGCQKEVFAAQIVLARRHAKPLIVHIRDAGDDSKAMLLAYGAGEVGGVLHCYNADEQLLSLSKAGFYYGIGGVLTFSNARKLLQVLPKIPRERLVIETDAPYLTPHPHRGSRNEPAYTTLVAAKMGELLDMTPAEVAELTTRNAEKLFNFKSV